MTYEFVNVSPNSVNYTFRFATGPLSRIRSVDINDERIVEDASRITSVNVNNERIVERLTTIDNGEGTSLFSYPVTMETHKVKLFRIRWSEEVQQDALIVYSQSTPVIGGIEVIVKSPIDRKIEIFTSATSMPNAQAMEGPGYYKWRCDGVMFPGEAMILHIPNRG